MSIEANSSTLEAKASGTDSLEGRYLTFVLSKQEYGIGILSVREIIAFQDITPIPGVPGYVEGVINLRGRIIPVIDLGQRLCFAQGARSDRTCIIVTEIESEDDGAIQVGCIVDTVSEVMQIPGTDIEPAPELGPSVDLDSVLGLAKIGEAGKVISLLDIHRVLGSLGGVSF